MALVLTTLCQLTAIQDHAEAIYPEECCGLLLGVYRNQGEADDHVADDHIVLEVLPTANAWSQSLLAQDSEQGSVSEERRYAIDAIAMVKAQQYARGKGWDIIGIYHSHPDHLAVPSEWDRTWAWPQYSYVIVSVQNGTAHDLQSWILDMHHEFLPEKLVISGTTDPQSCQILKIRPQKLTPKSAQNAIALLKDMKDNKNAQPESG
jgi:proteasome lid subunit RPN8/RPN11